MALCFLHNMPYFAVGNSKSSSTTQHLHLKHSHGLIFLLQVFLPYQPLTVSLTPKSFMTCLWLCLILLMLFYISHLWFSGIFFSHFPSFKAFSLPPTPLLKVVFRKMWCLEMYVRIFFSGDKIYVKATLIPCFSFNPLYLCLCVLLQARKIQFYNTRYSTTSALVYSTTRKMRSSSKLCSTTEIWPTVLTSCKTYHPRPHPRQLLSSGHP